MAATNNDLQLFSLDYAKVILKVLYKHVSGNVFQCRRNSDVCFCVCRTVCIFMTYYNLLLGVEKARDEKTTCSTLFKITKDNLNTN